MAGIGIGATKTMRDRSVDGGTSTFEGVNDTVTLDASGSGDGDAIDEVAGFVAPAVDARCAGPHMSATLEEIIEGNV